MYMDLDCSRYFKADGKDWMAFKPICEEKPYICCLSAGIPHQDLQVSDMASLPFSVLPLEALRKTDLFMDLYWIYLKREEEGAELMLTTEGVSP